MKKTVLFSLAYISTIAFFSCSSNESIACYLPPTTVSSNSPLVPGGTLQLNTPSYGNGTTYLWSGPNNFQSTIQNPSIANVTTAMAGSYQVKAVKGICATPEVASVVEIVAPYIPCSPASNKITFQSSMIPNSVTFNSIISSTSSGNYEIRASGANADLTIEFASSATPTAGIYSINGSCPTSFLSNGQVCVSLNYNNQYSNAHSGSVYLTNENGHLTATFCDLNFQISTITLVASTKVIVP